MQRRIDDLTGHFIVCAYGRVGRAVARELEAEGAAFVVVDPDERLVERMRDEGVAFIIDDPTHEHVLRAAGADRARGLVCAVDSDATNVYIALVARALNPELFIVARASEPGSDQRLLRAGANRVVSPFVSSGRHMALVAMRPNADDVVALGTSGGVLLAFYALGLAVPFILSALAFTTFAGVFRFFRNHYTAITLVSGTVLIVMGVLLYTNELTRLNSEALQVMDDLGINFFSEI